VTVTGRRIRVQGAVQGVGFRPWIWRLAHELGVTGTVHNGAEGVTIDAFGPEPVLEDLLARMQAEPPLAARIERLWWQAIPGREVAEFTIVRSRDEGAKRASIPPDLATCDACLAEILDPTDRRYHYPFTNCTDCGPRFTIAWDVPYDRPGTTMAPFTMCPVCQREYDDPSNRRFHAQPNACPVCGPRLALWDAGGEPRLVEDPLQAAADALREGAIVAIKGLGGFHLACDATDPAVVQALRDRKHREEKPFAVMVQDRGQAREAAALDHTEEALLAGIERPIVLLVRRLGGLLASAVAPDAPRVGLMLPYTPLHHLLLRAVGRPLVMTSGNVSGEPIAHTNELARQQLRGLADLFLVHDRAITTRTDDSVATVVSGHPQIWRRSRGYVPRPIHVQEPFAEPVLAVGAHLKNTFCLGVGDTAWLGPHIGDLESVSAYESLREGVERLERFLGVEPAIVAHDLHPGYLSTAYAFELRGEHVGVQHHHAHVVAAMAEHGLRGPVIGVAWDGTGLGTDGAAWGGEILLTTAAGFERAATLRPIPLAGGDTAVRQPWRVALALLEDAFEGAPPLDRLALFARVDPDALAVVRRQLTAQVNTPLAHGMGRLFDGLAALGLARPAATYEGQLAMAWEQAAAGRQGAPYPIDLRAEGAPWQLDPRPLVRAAVADLIDGAAPGEVAARFHAALIEVAARAVGRLVENHGDLPVVLTGGCFQNARLDAGLRRALRGGPTVHAHRNVPPGDGGVALGQAVVANAQRDRIHPRTSGARSPAGR